MKVFIILSREELKHSVCVHLYSAEHSSNVCLSIVLSFRSGEARPPVSDNKQFPLQEFRRCSRGLRARCFAWGLWQDIRVVCRRNEPKPLHLLVCLSVVS